MASTSMELSDNDAVPVKQAGVPQVRDLISESNTEEPNETFPDFEGFRL
jgi:hypothetical protein